MVLQVSYINIRKLIRTHDGVSLQDTSIQNAAVNAEARQYILGCFPATGDQYIHDITHWATAPNDEGTLPIYWMRGPAGFGKSAIVQTFAKRVKEAGQLGTAFFFSTNVQNASVQSKTTPFLWAIFGRPDPQIVAAFERENVAPFCHSVLLPISRDTDGQFEEYLRGGSGNILRRRNIPLSSRWPSDENIKKLVMASAGRLVQTHHGTHSFGHTSFCSASLDPRRAQSVLVRCYACSPTPRFEQYATSFVPPSISRILLRHSSW
ncbi:hypothetical protein AN958_05159 [Leucoagaricus sp. SymC.cos]|nr:hypothetical protein AN958_05159 [Leucoagaricus sp. SymC.cos]